MDLSAGDLDRLEELARGARNDLRALRRTYEAALSGLASPRSVAVLRAIELAVMKCDNLSFSVAYQRTAKGGR